MGEPGGSEQLGYYYRDRDRILVAIPKCGCTSIKTWLCQSHGIPVKGDIHRSFPDLRFALSRQRDAQTLLATLPIYAVVRHPLERLASAWRDKVRGVSFADFITRLEDPTTENPHWRLQAWFLRPGVQGIPLECMGDLCPGIGHYNAGKEKPDWTPELRCRAERLYREDLQIYEAACLTKCI